ncbi:unnamed protein product [Caenorhabditis auriculariae]|uniref:Uncharacterized protein n=1 Tax=Caenorhabditis auriculariae TaxID=2777116 RepID=A0A8S1GV03_9PELO|nr:unnamed protein product [Caenorhabditis auriculariae]
MRALHVFLVALAIVTVLILVKFQSSDAREADDNNRTEHLDDTIFLGNRHHVSDIETTSSTTLLEKNHN